MPQGKAPDGIGLLIKEETAATTWNQVYWGLQPISCCYPYFLQTYMGPVPAARDQWIQLVVSRDDAGLMYAPGQYRKWAAFGYQLRGGEADWDVTTTVSD